MTSFAFIAGMIPLVISTGAGAIGNRTIGGSAMGGMLFGTLFGVIVVPGLYFIFGTLADKGQLIKNQDAIPLSEAVSKFANKDSDKSTLRKLKIMMKLMQRKLKNNKDTDK